MRFSQTSDVASGPARMESRPRHPRRHPSEAPRQRHTRSIRVTDCEEIHRFFDDPERLFPAGATRKGSVKSKKKKISGS
jgi:hypothetical protein